MHTCRILLSRAAHTHVCYRQFWRTRLRVCDNLLPVQAFYAATFGFLRNLATTPSTSIVFSLTTRQYTAVHASGVTLINTLASPAGQMNFTMPLPGGAYLPTSVIVKSSESNSDGRVTYACSVSGYTQTQTRYNGPVSKGMWYGTSVTAGSRGSDAGVCVGYVSGVVGVM